jgi:hypothetical protein
MALPTVLVIQAETVGIACGLAAQCLTPYKLFLLSIPMSLVLPRTGTIKTGTGAGTIKTTAPVSTLGCLLGSSCSILSAAEVCTQLRSSAASRSALSAALRRWYHPRANFLSRGGENYGGSSANDRLLHPAGPMAQQHAEV